MTALVLSSAPDTRAYIVTTLLMTKVSGIPMLENGAQKRWGDEPESQDYTRNTSVLIPLPPKV